MQHFDIYQIIKFLSIPYNALLAVTLLISGIILCIPSQKKYSILAQEITQKTGSQNFQFIDIRQNTDKRIPKSKLLNIIELSKAQNLHKYLKNKNEYIIIIAEDYKKATYSLKILQQNAYNNVFILENGIEGWKQAGFPLHEKSIKQV